VVVLGCNYKPSQDKKTVGQRFSDIRRAKKLADQLAGYVTYLSTPRVYTTPYKARLKRIPMQLLPFGGGIETGKKVATSYEDKPENSALVTAVNVVADLETRSPAAINVVGFRPARVTRVTASTKTVTEKKSKFTNVDYRKYDVDRASIPFGAKAAGDEYFAVTELLKPALQSPTLAICWVSFSPENQAGR
jgi:hypothetical protein